MAEETIAADAVVPPLEPPVFAEKEPAKKKATKKKAPMRSSPPPEIADVIAKARALPDFDDDDDLDDEEMLVARPPSRRGPPMSPAQFRNRAMQEQDKNNEEFETYLSSLEFDGGNHSVTVHRVEPEYDPDTGKRIAGYLEKFNRAVTFEEIRSKYGGGKYRFIIHGPGAFGKPMVKANKVHEIAGDPILVGVRKTNNAQPVLPQGVETLVRDAISTSEKQVDRLMEENKNLQQLMLASVIKKDDGLKEAVLSMQPQFQQQVLEERRLQEQRLSAEREERRREQERLQQIMLEERRQVEKLAEERRREEAEYRRVLEKKEAQEREDRRREQERLQQVMLEERRLAEQRAEERLAAEREERRREKEAEDRRHREMLEMFKIQAEREKEERRMELERVRLEQKEQAEREKEERRMELERVRLEQREQAERAKQQFDLQLKMLERQEQEKETRAMKWSEFQHAMQQQQMQMLQQMQQMQIATLQQSEKDKVAFLQTQMQMLQRKSDPFEDMMKVKQFMDVLSGNTSEDSRETWEKVLDRLSDGVPGLVAAAGLLRGGSGEQTQLAAPTEPAVLPGSVAVVDEGVVSMRRRRRRTAARAPDEVDVDVDVGEVTQTAQTAQTAAQTTPKAQQAIPAADATNGLKEFAFPTEDMEPEQVLELLVKDIEVALRKDYTAAQIKTEVVDKFPEDMKALLSSLDASLIVSFLEDKAPSDWRINSLDGQRKIVQLHELLSAND